MILPFGSRYIDDNIISSFEILSCNLTLIYLPLSLSTSITCFFHFKFSDIIIATPFLCFKLALLIEYPLIPHLSLSFKNVSWIKAIYVLSFPMIIVDNNTFFA